MRELAEVRQRLDRLEELARSREFLADLVERSPHAVVIHSGGVIRWADAAAGALLGTEDPTGLVDRPLMDFIDPSCEVSGARRLTTWLRDGETRRADEAVLLRTDGRTVVVEDVPRTRSGRGERRCRWCCGM